jgi:hypothetical protein
VDPYILGEGRGPVHIRIQLKDINTTQLQSRTLNAITQSIVVTPGLIRINKYLLIR